MDYQWKEPCASCGIFDKCGGSCLYSNHLRPWDPEGTAEVCTTVRFLISELGKRMPEIRELIEDGTISIRDFVRNKYKGTEIIP